MPKDQYHKQKNQLFRKILRDLEPLARKLPEGFEPFCHHCGAKKSEVNELHVDHPNGNPEETSQDMDGWDYYYMYRRQFQGGVTLWPTCVVCHYLFHRTRDDQGDTSLSNHRKYLSEYESVDPVMELARRREKKQERLIEMVQEEASPEEEPENGRRSILQKVQEVVPDEPKEIEEVIDEVEADEDAARNALETLKRDGEVFEPQAGKVQSI